MSLIKSNQPIENQRFSDRESPKFNNDNQNLSSGFQLVGSDRKLLVWLYNNDKSSGILRCDYLA